MRVGNIVKLIGSPSMDWMENYLDETFEIQDFFNDCFKIKMVDTDPEWIWHAAKENFELVEDEGFLEVISELPSR